MNLLDYLAGVKPIVKSRFKKLQQIRLEAELYFMNNFKSITLFNSGFLDDSRLYGDGYDFQVSVNEKSYLAEVKGIREKKSAFRLTENEYNKTIEYKDDYVVAVLINLNDSLRILAIPNSIQTREVGD